MRSNLIWVSVVAVLIVVGFVYLSFPGEKESSQAATPVTKAGKGESRPSASSKSTRRLDFAKTQSRNGLLYGPEDDRPFTGTLEKEHPGGGRQAEIPIRDGVIDGVMKTFDENGTLRVRAVYEDGVLVSKREWDKDGVELGESGDPDPYGDLLARRDADRQVAPLLAGRPQPILDGIDPSEGIEVGDLQERAGIAYRSDTREPYTGKALRRFTDGSRWERNYVNGVRHGEFSYYHPNGQMQSQELYVNGRKDGVYTMYFENGQKRYEAELVNGKQVGIATSWNQQGQVISRWEHTVDGERINLLAPNPPRTENESNPPPVPAVEDESEPAEN